MTVLGKGPIAMRIGLFGGTFNPIHLGHLRSALEVLSGFELQKIILIPSAVPPHKTPSVRATARDRLAMVKKAATAVPQFEVSQVELQRSGPSYTVDTLAHYRTHLPPATELFFIVGLDAFLEIETWRSHHRLFEQSAFIVMTRPGTQAVGTAAMAESVATHLEAQVAAGYCFSKRQCAFVHPTLQSVHLCAVTAMGISSSAIRSSIRNQRSIRFLVPESVRAFIEEKGLYL